MSLSPAPNQAFGSRFCVRFNRADFAATAGLEMLAQRNESKCTCSATFEILGGAGRDGEPQCKFSACLPKLSETRIPRHAS